MTLAELIATMPGESTATDAEVLTWLQTAVDTWQDIPWLELTIWTHTSGVDRPTLETAASSGATVEDRTAAQHVIDCINAGQPLSASKQQVRDIIGASSLSGTAKTALTALATTQAPRWTFRDPSRAMEAIAKARAI